MSSRRILAVVFTLAVVSLLLPTALRADTVTFLPTPPSGGDVILTLFALSTSPTTPVVSDVRGGPALGFVSSTGGFVAVGDFGGAPPSSPNQLLLSVNFPGVSEVLVMTLNFGSVSVNGPTTIVSAFTAPFSGPITDPSLLAMLGSSVLNFVYVTAFIDPNNPNVVISQWALTSIQVVPEPATLFLTMSGLLGIGALRRRRAAKRSSVC